MPDWRLDHLEEVNRSAAVFYARQLQRSPHVTAYLDNRLGSGTWQSLTQAGGGRWIIGYAPDNWTAAVDFLRRNHTDENIIAAGIGVLTKDGRLVDRVRDRVMIGVHTDNGRLAGFVGRTLGQVTEQNPKYLNTPANDLFKKGELMLGLHEQRPELTSGGVPVVVEGPFDALATLTLIRPSGRIVPIAPSGTAVTPDHLALLDSVTPAGKEWVFALDGDDAGRAAAVRASELALTLARPIYVTMLPTGHDPSSYAHETGPAAIGAYLGGPRRVSALQAIVDARIDTHTDHLAWVEGRVAAMRDAARILARYNADVIVAPALHVAQRLQLDPVHVSDAVAEARSANDQAAGRLHDRAVELRFRVGTAPARLAALGHPRPASQTLAAVATPARPRTRSCRPVREPDQSPGR